MLLLFWSLLVGSVQQEAEVNPSEELPNFVVVFADDLGYGDLGCYGGTEIRTPHLERFAGEGMRFTDFYAQTVCGPSRAALMTGCYPLRVAKHTKPLAVHPWLHSDEVTIAEVLRERGYVSGCFGKWDLAGHTQTKFDPSLLPTEQGFDTFFGTPTSNDGVVHLFAGSKQVEQKADMSLLTRRYTDAAIEFIQEHRERPFFVYLPHTMPHTKLAASDEFRGRSPRGLYGDVVEELDHEFGRLLDALDDLKLTEKTYVVFLSDNGPWHMKGEHGGSSGPLRSAKTSTWEGGLRVPCIARKPGAIPAGSVCSEVATTMDLLPTFARLAGATLPTDRVIDGHDIGPLLQGEPGAKSPTEAFFYYQHVHLQAVRAGRWKLHVTRPANPPWTPNWARQIAAEDVFDIERPLLFDLVDDLGERNDVAAENPEVVERLLALVEKGRRDIGDHDLVGSGARAFGAQRRP